MAKVDSVPGTPFQDFERIDEWIANVEEEDFRIFAKYLSANDTGATGGHQGGPLIPRTVLGAVFPELTFAEKQKVVLPAVIDSQSYEKEVTATWYSSKNEGRITGWGGAKCDLLDADNTGALTLFAFATARTNGPRLRIWICSNIAETESVLEWLGELDPGDWFFGELGSTAVEDATPCLVAEEDLPEAWQNVAPKGVEVIEFVIDVLGRCPPCDVDSLLLCRRHCEFEVFKTFERAKYLPAIRAGFEGLEDFLALAQTITQSRRSRAGNSLEYHLKRIFDAENVAYEWQAETENGNRPDFIFPSALRYSSASEPSGLRMLAVKTSCKDRWRQILEEAQKIPHKHLFTLSEGLSLNQFAQMQHAGIQLVVPQERKKAFPKSVRGKLMNLREFIDEVSTLPT